MRFLYPHKAIGLALLALVPLATSSQAQSTAPADWRLIATPADRNRIERWEELFGRAQAWVGAMNGTDTLGGPTASFTAVRQGRPVLEFEGRWAGRHLCRSILVNAEIVAAYSWFQCRLSLNDGGWKLEKVAGSIHYELTFFGDAQLGSVALGSYWPRIGNRTTYSNAQENSNSVGVVRLGGSRRLRIFLPSDRWYEVIEIDLAR
jgi:hypothetical protein